MTEHECGQLEKIGEVRGWIGTATTSLTEIKVELKEQGKALAEIAVKVKNVEREVFSGNNRGSSFRQVAIPAGAVVAVLEGLRWMAQHFKL